MKTKIAIIVLAVASFGLVIAMFATKKQAEKQHEDDVSSISDFSNQVVNAEVKINDLSQVNIALTNDLAASRTQIALSSQQVEQLSNSLTTITGALKTTQDSLDATRGQVASLTMKVGDLEAQNKALDQRAAELTNALVQLNGLIEETRNKLAVSNTDRQFLQAELQKQLAQKAEIEHRFNDLAELRLQVKKIKTEMFVARRTRLDKNGNIFKKGAELLIQRTVVAPKPSAAKPGNYDLNVEVGSDGSVKVIPPLPATNSAAQ